eukprot:2031964-Amphidinium_carterae.1
MTLTGWLYCNVTCGIWPKSKSRTCGVRGKYRKDAAPAAWQVCISQPHLQSCPAELGCRRLLS